MSAIALPRPARAPGAAERGAAFLTLFAAVAVGLGAARALTTAYLPVLLDRIAHRPGLIGAVMLVNAAAGFVVPLATGLWSDRSGRRGVFIGGGVLLAAGGLVAIALGTASTYLALAAAAAMVYVGLNAAATAHRTLVAERFEDARRPRATTAQELAMLAGALLATVAGGILIDASPALLFAAAAVVVGLLALPTLALPLVREAAPVAAPSPAAASEGRLAVLLHAARTPGAREVLLAQLLWVFAYAALTPFMVLYAEQVLGIGTGAAGLLLAGFGLLTGAGMLAAGALPPRRVGPALVLGTALLGGGLVAAAPATGLAAAALPFAAAAVGAGLVTALGFPYFARFIPGGEAGTYSGAFFSARAAAAAAALPAAGALVAATGSYRWLLLQGGTALLAVVPLLRARRIAAGTHAAPAAAARPPLCRVVAVIPVFRSARLEAVTLAALEHVDEVLLVDDGSPPHIARRAAALAAREARVGLLLRPGNGGKGAALADAFAELLARPAPPDAVLTLDSDGQHPPDRIPAFLAAAREADAVLGCREGRSTGRMPLVRRAGNALTAAALSVATRRRLRDTQNGMRLLRTDLLRRVPLEPGRFESETRHLKALARAGAVLSWVSIPTVYAGEPSSFRPLRDSARVAREVLRGPSQAPLPGWGALAVVLRAWWPRLALGVLAILVIGALLPLLQPADERLYHEVNRLGDGPGWLYEALDPHSRNYALITLLAVAGAAVTLRRARYAAGAGLLVVFAALSSDAVLEIGQILFDRPRPQEVLGAGAQPIHDRDWTRIPSYPSGHLMVTAAMIAATRRLLPRLSVVLVGYLVAVAFTRVIFGAHFPIDVIVGGIVGWEVGLFSVALVRASGMLPTAGAGAVASPAPEPASAQPVGVMR